VSSETERITNLVMNRHDYDKLAQRLGQLHLAEWDRCYNKGSEPSLATPLSMENTKTANLQPDSLVMPRL
jgi:hypothetical protein